MKKLIKHRNNRILPILIFLLFSLVLTACEKPVGKIEILSITPDTIYVNEEFEVTYQISATHDGFALGDLRAEPVEDFVTLK